MCSSIKKLVLIVSVTLLAAYEGKQFSVEIFKVPTFQLNVNIIKIQKFFYVPTLFYELKIFPCKVFSASISRRLYILEIIDN